MITCHSCGGQGHVARDCQMQPAEATGRPAWCGECDKRTRLIDHGTFMQRCHRCWAWPSRGTRFHQLLPQHQLCGGCHQIAYAWDSQQCGSHTPLAISVTGHQSRLPKPPPAIAAITKRDTP